MRSKTYDYTPYKKRNRTAIISASSHKYILCFLPKYLKGIFLAVKGAALEAAFALVGKNKLNNVMAFLCDCDQNIKLWAASFASHHLHKYNIDGPHLVSPKKSLALIF